MRPELPLTVSISLWTAVADLRGRSWADSYLSGATETATTLQPRGETAWRRWGAAKDAMKLLADRHLRLIPPAPMES